MTRQRVVVVMVVVVMRFSGAKESGRPKRNKVSRCLANETSPRQYRNVPINQDTRQHHCRSPPTNGLHHIAKNT
ncbi:hypothetical protein E2C01_002471 [Portunus trituberculatus]|uniref:Secreted protein n=1 Tax=Portunus trituberculatus TaxID=210409 RepID=A0A5B7CMC9_PORTR|nr:hypothetical protein [Portunus trituberculatus]